MPRLKKLHFTPVNLMVTAAIVLLLFAFFAWWQFVYMSPSRIFGRMLATSLSSVSVTRRTVQSDTGQQLVQTMQLTTSPVTQVHATALLTQTQDTSTTVDTESIGTPTTDYVRYNSIKTTQKNAAGKAFDFSSILGIWGRTEQNDASGGPQLYSQALFGVVPTGDLPASQREALIEFIGDNDVYHFDASNVTHKRVNGRPVYTYKVQVMPVAYVGMLKQFARDAGLKQLEQVDPTQYANSQALSFTFEIDGWSGELTKVSYNDSPREDTYTSYGVRNTTALPTSSIPVDELQTRLQNLQ